jgi:hypothetical protein
MSNYLYCHHLSPISHYIPQHTYTNWNFKFGFFSFTLATNLKVLLSQSLHHLLKRLLPSLSYLLDYNHSPLFFQNSQTLIFPLKSRTNNEQKPQNLELSLKLKTKPQLNIWKPIHKVVNFFSKLLSSCIFSK